jgi:hypothetical protein
MLLCALSPETHTGYFCEQKTASATQPQPCPVGTFYDSAAASSAQSCKPCPNPEDCKDAGKSAPDCEPTVWRPSTFWCYDARQQALIIVGAFASCVTSLWGGFVLYNKYKLGHQRLTRLGVDLMRVTRPARVLAKALLADKCIKLHKLKDPITYSTLWNSLPFDEEQDSDIGDVIDSRILKLFSELEKQSTPLGLKHFVDVVRLSKVSHQQPDDAQTGVAQLSRRHSSAAAGGARDGSVGSRNDPGTNSSARRDPLRPRQAVVISQDSHDSAFTSSHANRAAEPPNSSSSAAPLNEVIIQPQRERSRPPPLSSRAERSRPHPQPLSGEPKLSDASGAPPLQPHVSGKGSDLTSSSKNSSAVTSPPPSVKTGSKFASPGSSRAPASQLQEFDAALEIDVISSTPHLLGQVVVGAEAASTSASAQSPQVQSLRALQHRSIHRTSATAAASFSSNEPSTTTQPSASTSRTTLAVPSSQSTATAMSSIHAIIPSPPRSRSKSRGRAPASSPLSANSESSGHHVPSATTPALVSSALAVQRSQGAAVAVQHRDGELTKKRSSGKSKDAPPPLTVMHRLRIMGAEFEEC